MPAEHIAPTGVNTFGTTFDLIVRPSTASDPRCDEIIRRVVESVMVAFPSSAQQGIEDAVVTAIAAADGRFSQLNLIRISSDAGNMAKRGSDDGIFIGQRFTSTTMATSAGVASTASMAIPFGDTNYVVSVEPSSDPGAFRWWITAKTGTNLTIGFHTANAVFLNINAKG